MRTKASEPRSPRNPRPIRNRPPRGTRFCTTIVQSALERIDSRREPDLLASSLLRLNDDKWGRRFLAHQPAASLPILTHEAAAANRTKETFGSAGRHQSDGLRAAVNTAMERSRLSHRKDRCVLSVERITSSSPLGGDWSERPLHAIRWKGTLLDISLTRAVILLPEAMEKDERVSLYLTKVASEQQWIILGWIIQASSEGDGQWKLVCQFDRKLTLQQIHDFGDLVISVPMT